MIEQLEAIIQALNNVRDDVNNLGEGVMSVKTFVPSKITEAIMCITNQIEAITPNQD